MNDFITMQLSRCILGIITGSITMNMWGMKAAIPFFIYFFCADLIYIHFYKKVIHSKENSNE